TLNITINNMYNEQETTNNIDKNKETTTHELDETTDIQSNNILDKDHKTNPYTA
ncbi:3216_t:CDS:1, partial [Cetraspora pellucida]